MSVPVDPQKMTDVFRFVVNVLFLVANNLSMFWVHHVGCLLGFIENLHYISEWPTLLASSLTLQLSGTGEYLAVFFWGEVNSLGCVSWFTEKWWGLSVWQIYLHDKIRKAYIGHS